MVQQSIKIFARLKPIEGTEKQYKIKESEDGSSIVRFNVPRELSDGYINNKKEDFKFKFERVFDRNAKQDEIFSGVAQPVIDNVLQGYNGTIFAYGQTGTGKTFTMAGVDGKYVDEKYVEPRYVDRGIIPRTLSYIFEHCKNNPEYAFTIHISYLQIYNDNAYDLVNPKFKIEKLEHLPKVHLLEDADKNIHLQNLSTHQVNDDGEAIDVLLMGDVNKYVAETQMNKMSTRSHCIFTVHISTHEPGSTTLRHSKLHLVDLAGSERVSKTGAKGVLLTEAKCINKSLHFLEQVIVSLSDKGRDHIPYRNSMLTSMLRDSLGGNCMTTMIATCSVEKDNLYESISTCRFAQRVALIKNDAIQNEELDPKLRIAKLEREVLQLKEELAMKTGEQRTDALSEEDYERCKDAVQQYLDDTDPEASLNVGADMRKIQQCHQLLKQAVLDRGKYTSIESNLSTMRGNNEQEPDTHLHSAETKKLSELVLEKENEINILVDMLKKERALNVSNTLHSHGHESSFRPNAGMIGNVESQSVDDRRERRQGEWPQKNHAPQTNRDDKVINDMSMGRQEALEIFKRDHPEIATIEEKKQAISEKYAEVKLLGKQMKMALAAVNDSKASIQKHRLETALQGKVDINNPEPDEIEQQLTEKMKMRHTKYKQVGKSLTSLKSEIEHLRYLYKKSKVRLLKDFESWWAEQAAILQQKTPQHQTIHPSSQRKNAWQTPPLSPTQSWHSHSTSSSSNTSLQSKHSVDPSQLNVGQTYNYYNGKSHVAQSCVKRSVGDQAETSGYDSSASSLNRPHSNRKAQKEQNSGEKIGGIPITGDDEVDANIMAFVKARQNVAQHAYQNSQERS